MSLDNLKSELVYLIRNANILTIAQRGVTTTTTSLIPIVSATSYTLNVANVKNIRTLTVGATTLKYGHDYTVDLDFMDTTKKCKITFRTAKTGDLQITYDAGTDKIFNDYPRVDLSISSYPRIGLEEISKSTQNLSLGGLDFISSRVVTILVLAENADDIETYIAAIESLIRTNAKSLYYAKYISPTGRGPLIKHMARNDTILQKNVDLLAKFEVE
jgi:hypothetical protein